MPKPNQQTSHVGYFIPYLGTFYFLLSESARLVKNAEVELVMKPRHPTSIGNTLFSQILTLMCSVEIFLKGTVT